MPDNLKAQPLVIVLTLQADGTWSGTMRLGEQVFMLEKWRKVSSGAVNATAEEIGGTNAE